MKERKQKERKRNRREGKETEVKERKQKESKGNRSKGKEIEGKGNGKDKGMQKTEIHVKDKIEILEKSERYVMLFDWCS